MPPADSAPARRLKELSDRLVAAQRPIRILDAVKWEDEIERCVLRSGFTTLPPVDEDYYRDQRPLSFDPEEKLRELEEIRRDTEHALGDHPLGAILRRNCAEYQDVVRLLRARGTLEFYRLSRKLYGGPTERFPDGRTTVVELARVLRQVLGDLKGVRLGATHPADLPAGEVVDELNRRFSGYFADHAVHARLDDGIVSDAAAGADYVKVRRAALFSRRDVEIMEVHEGWVHIATSLNGSLQPHASWLAKGPPCVTSVQEGLSVLMEIFTFNMTPDRARKIYNRILACAMAEDGADFIEVCRFFQEQGYRDEQCYQHARRVFRGGVITGGAPFTKDISYGKGFVLIYNFLRTAIRYQRPEIIPFLFAGKVTLEDVPVLHRFHGEGLVDPPRYLPAQFRDLSGLAVWFAFSSFLGRVDHERIQEYYRGILTSG